MSFAVVIEGMTLIAFVVVLGGGKQKREVGWKVVSGLLLLVGLIQCTGMALMVSYFQDEKTEMAEALITKSNRHIFTTMTTDSSQAGS